MPLQPGDKLGHYEVLSLLGVGGMGEVYRAKDSKLDRQVAIKVLPSALARDPERLARFEREAKVLASLDHPNVGHIYGIVDSADSHGLVLALIEGPTLEDRIAAGPIPLEEAVAISKQIIEALEYAHDRGVVHRDLKPANVKITPEGVVKVLDFGLAKVLEDEPPPPSPSNSPTLTLGHTRNGVILGTAAYMSPEQAVGRPVDRRSDIFSFGAVPYEILTGKRAFIGATTPDVLEAVVKNDPDWSVLPTGTPAYLRRLLERTLAKDRKERLQAIGEARIVLAKPQSDELASAASATALSASRSGRLPWTAAAALAVIAVAITFLHFREPAAEAHVVKLSMTLPENVTLQQPSYLAVSPDGRHLAFVAIKDGTPALWVRDLDSLMARPLRGTESPIVPFWSPDSRSLAFFSKGKLRKIDIVGGAVIALCDAQLGRGGSWSKDGVILFAGLRGGLLHVSADGGPVTPATALDPASSETTHRAPSFLPDGRHFVYQAGSSDSANDAIYLGELDSPFRRKILTGLTQVSYAPPGYLVFQRQGTLWAQRFDPVKARTTGSAVALAEQVGLYEYSASQSLGPDGVVSYVAGRAEEVQLTWFDRSGKVSGVVGPPGTMYFPMISPDGTIAAVSRQDPETSTSDIWLHDLGRGTNTRFTSANMMSPVWSPDGSRIGMRSSNEGSLYTKPVRGSGPAELFHKDERRQRTMDWSRDGKYIVKQVTDPKTREDIWVIPMSGDRKPFPYLTSEFNEDYARISPDGKWLVYQSDESKRTEVYVQSFPTPGNKVQISTDGGRYPVWSRDGRELYFIAPDGKMMAVAVKMAGKFEAGAPQALFDSHIGSLGFDVNKDGRFLIPAQKTEGNGAQMTVVINWTAGLKKN